MCVCVCCWFSVVVCVVVRWGLGFFFPRFLNIFYGIWGRTVAWVRLLVEAGGGGRGVIGRDGFYICIYIQWTLA